MTLYDTEEHKICEGMYAHCEHGKLNFDTFCCPRCYKTVIGDSADLKNKAKKCKCDSIFI